jgi:hypothetical protein
VTNTWDLVIMDDGDDGRPTLSMRWLTEDNYAVITIGGITGRTLGKDELTQIATFAATALDGMKAEGEE